MRIDTVSQREMDAAASLLEIKGRIPVDYLNHRINHIIKAKGWDIPFELLFKVFGLGLSGHNMVKFCDWFETHGNNITRTCSLIASKYKVVARSFKAGPGCYVAQNKNDKVFVILKINRDKTLTIENITN